MKFHRILLLLALPVYLFSCSPSKYFSRYMENAVDSSGYPAAKFPELRIQKDDLLSIQVYSLSLDPKVDEPFNIPMTNTTANPQLYGVLVDANGDISYPRLGTFHVEGLTKQELAQLIKKKLTEPKVLLSDPTVIIRFLNFKVMVLGQVGHEGMINAPGERMTILEAVGLAGGVTDYGKKETVKIIREVNGKHEIGTINLASTSLFESPYYNLEQNDLVYVEPTTTKIRQENQSIVAQRISFALSLITALAFIYNIFK